MMWDKLLFGAAQKGPNENNPGYMPRPVGPKLDGPTKALILCRRSGRDYRAAPPGARPAASLPPFASSGGLPVAVRPSHRLPAAAMVPQESALSFEEGEDGQLCLPAVSGSPRRLILRVDELKRRGEIGSAGVGFALFVLR